MTESKTKNENYFKYLIFEIIIMSVITFLGVGLIVFYSMGRSDTRRDTRHLEYYFFDNPLYFGVICLLPAVTAILFVVYFRNRNYIIGYSFDHAEEKLSLCYRGILKKKKSTIEIPYSDVITKKIKERKILFNHTYKGVRINSFKHKLRLDFIVNNFIWEEQPREKVHFMKEMYNLKNKEYLV